MPRPLADTTPQLRVVDAAYKWVFKPTTVNGEPIKVQGVPDFQF